MDEVSRYTGYEKSYLYQLTSGKKIPHFKPTNGAVFFRRDELEEWLSRNRIKTMDEIREESNQFQLK